MHNFCLKALMLMFTAMLLLTHGFAFAQETTLSADEPQPITIGETISGTLDDSNTDDIFTFTASQENWLRLSSEALENGQQAYEALILLPDGTPFGGLTVADIYTAQDLVLDPLRLPISGDYRLVIRRVDMSGSGDLQPVTYHVTLAKSQAQLIQAGAAVEGSVGGKIREQIYRYEATAGETIRITLENTDSQYAPGAWVEGPRLNGENPLQFTVMGSAPGTITYEVTLPSDGGYLFRISNSMEITGTPTVGTYRLLVETVQN